MEEKNLAINAIHSAVKSKRISFKVDSFRKKFVSLLKRNLYSKDTNLNTDNNKPFYELKKFLENEINIFMSKGLEIGPSYNPIFPKYEYPNVFTVDHTDKEELIQKYGNSKLKKKNSANIRKKIWRQLTHTNAENAVNGNAQYRNNKQDQQMNQ